MRHVAAVFAVLVLLSGYAYAQDAPRPSPKAMALDWPNDHGEAMEVKWAPSPDDPKANPKGSTMPDTFLGYRIERSRTETGPWEVVRVADPNEDGTPKPDEEQISPPGSGKIRDGADINVREPWFYRVTAIAKVADSDPLVLLASAPVVTATPGTAHYNWFKLGLFNNFMVLFIFSGLILGWVWAAGGNLSAAWVIGFFLYTGAYVALIAMDDQHSTWQLALPFLGPILAIIIPIMKRGGDIYIRPIPAIQAVEEAIGRATEMGKPILFVPGISTIEDVATLAALNILAPVAEKAAQYDSKLIVPNYDPIVYTVTQEVVKEAYLKAGRPDAYSDENVFFLSARQFAYAAAVNGIMMREKPATNFFLGMFYAESLLLAETGNMTGAIQIAGTDAVTQLPFFIVACDYTLIGEELYAAGAYMGGDPKLTGSLKGQDWNKALILLFLMLSAVGYIAYGLVKSPTEWSPSVRDFPNRLFAAEDR